MKYTYRFANGDVNEIEVTEDQAFALADLDRLEYNNDHANTRRHISLEMAMEDEGMQFPDPIVEEFSALFENDDRKALLDAFAQLLPSQRALLRKVYGARRSYADIARDEGVDRSAIRKRMERIHEVLKKSLR
jgi:DNA-directed RNA polymerase specialized sigma24 family protein